jgi:putative alpha-1,2-mannosidase
MFAQAAETGFGGGKALDAFSGLENTYNHGNQPSLQIAWLFNLSGRPHLTQYWVRRICDEFYGSDRLHGYGYGQDEDQGQLGAWYVLAAMGLFDVEGGTAKKPTMQLSVPLFPKIEVALHSRYYPGKQFRVEVVQSSENAVYLAEARVGSQRLERPEVTWKSITSGGELQLQASERAERVSK